MPFDPPVPTDRIKKSFADLSAVASALNQSSDRLTASVLQLEEEIKKLGLGITAGVVFKTTVIPKTSDELWYSRSNSKWGFTIKSRSGDRRANKKVDIWPFGEAPRNLRVLAVPFIPELLDALGKAAADMIAEVDTKAKQVSEMTSAVAQPPQPAAKPPSVTLPVTVDLDPKVQQFFQGIHAASPLARFGSASVSVEGKPLDYPLYRATPTTLAVKSITEVFSGTPSASIGTPPPITAIKPTGGKK